MHLKTTLFIALLALGTASCRKETDPGSSASGLRANSTYSCDTVVHTGPQRMFTVNGEVTDATVINQYLAIHPWLAPGVGTEPEAHPHLIFPTASTTVYYNGLIPYTTGVQGNTIDMRQQDTSWSSGSQSASGTDWLYSQEQQYAAMLSNFLDMQGSYRSLERTDPQTIKTGESLHLKGSYNNGVVTLPFTFFASRAIWNSYPLPLRSSFSPNVASGDTLLVQEGTVSFKIK